MSLMGMAMIMCRSAYLTTNDDDHGDADNEQDEIHTNSDDEKIGDGGDDDDDDDDDDNYNYDNKVKNDHDDDYRDEVMLPGKFRQSMHKTFDSEQASYYDGSYVSDDEDLYTSVGKPHDPSGGPSERKLFTTSVPRYIRKFSMESLFAANKKY
jgi:hypothetical protein